MKSWKKILGLALSAALLVGTLAGCTKPENDPKTTASPSANPTAAATGAAPLVETEDMVQKLVGIPADTTVFTVEGEAVTAEQLYYWLSYAIENVGYYNFGGSANIDWTLEEEGKSIASYILDSAKQTATFYRILENMVNEKNTTLTEEEQATLQKQIADNIQQIGEEEHAKQLQQMCLSDAGYRHMMEVTTRFQKLQETLFGEGGEFAPTSDELVAMAEEQGLMLAKHILFKTKADDRTTPLSDEEIAAAKAKAESVLAQLQAVSGEEQLKLFDTLMQENSQDPGLATAPDGYLFGTGVMHQTFEDGTKALEYNQVSGIVETSDGYHIILRLKPDNASLADVSSGATLEQLWQNKVTDEWLAAAKVEDSAEMDKVDVQAFYEKLAAYRASLVPATPAPTETAAPTETTVPSESPAPTPSAEN